MGNARKAFKWVFFAVLSFLILLYLIWMRENPEVTWLGMKQFFWFEVLYTSFVIGFGVRAIAIYKDRYTTLRTLSLMTVQLVFGFLIPFLLPDQLGGARPENLSQGVRDPNDIGFTYFLFTFWPLDMSPLLIGKYYQAVQDPGILSIVRFYLGYALIFGLILMPVAVYFLGIRVYCSWICSCGALAETVGDLWRTEAPKKKWSERFEYVAYPILGWTVIVTIGALVTRDIAQFVSGNISPYDFYVKFILSSAIGVGAYPLLGARIWCRYFCPWRALFGLISLKGRYEIKSEKGLCMACGLCSHVCEMGIDVRRFAMAGKPVRTATCVGDGMCILACPRKVLSFSPVMPKKREKLGGNCCAPRAGQGCGAQLEAQTKSKEEKEYDVTVT